MFGADTKTFIYVNLIIQQRLLKTNNKKHEWYIQYQSRKLPSETSQSAVMKFAFTLRISLSVIKRQLSHSLSHVHSHNLTEHK